MPDTEVLNGTPERCPTCRINWKLFPPAKVSGSNGSSIRCIECKSTFSDANPVLTHARAMSGALLKVRPLCGSEMFSKVGEEYFADPEKCGEEIDRLRTELHEARTTRIRFEKAARNIAPYLHWTIGDESPGHHPTMPSAVAAFCDAFGLSHSKTD